jgi:hypothetical protein
MEDTHGKQYRHIRSRKTSPAIQTLLTSDSHSVTHLMGGFQEAPEDCSLPPMQADLGSENKSFLSIQALYTFQDPDMVLQLEMNTVRLTADKHGHT